jgi:hypothetical protein
MDRSEEAIRPASEVGVTHGPANRLEAVGHLEAMHQHEETDPVDLPEALLEPMPTRRPINRLEGTDQATSQLEATAMAEAEAVVGAEAAVEPTEGILSELTPLGFIMTRNCHRRKLSTGDGQ